MYTEFSKNSLPLPFVSEWIGILKICNTHVQSIREKPLLIKIRKKEGGEESRGIRALLRDGRGVTLKFQDLSFSNMDEIFENYKT